MVKVAISLSLTKELIETIDKVKGLATRSAYVDFILNEKLKELSNGN